MIGIYINQSIKKAFKTTFIGIFVFIFVTAGLFFSSCNSNVGLGESVDTEAPKVAIEYPPANAVVRQHFILAGTCSDDRGVARVEVTIANYAGAYKISNVMLKKSEDSPEYIWETTINEKGDGELYPLLDGKYTFQAVAYDDIGRESGRVERAIEIDNTEPVFIIKSPGVTEIKNATSYGSTFKVSGNIADDHDIKTFDLEVFDPSKQPVSIEFHEENISTAGGTEVTFAQYDKNLNYTQGGTTLNDKYLDLYGGSEVTGDKSFYCTVKISDEAGVWRTPIKVGGGWNTVSDDSEDDSGNTTTELFLYDDVYTQYMGKASEYKLGASDFKNIFNGSFAAKETSAETSKNAAVKSEARASGTITPDVAKTLKDELSKLFTDTKETPLAFKINKDANPLYEFSGYALDKANNSYDFSKQSASKGSKITFTAKMGLDETLIDPKKITVYVFGPFSGEKADVATVDAEIAKIYANPQDYYDGLKDKKLATVLFDGKTAYTGATVQSFTQTFTMGDIADSKKYVLAAYGMDEDGLEFVESTQYGFSGMASGQPPRVTITSPTSSQSVINATYVKNNGMKVAGYATSSMNKIKEIRYEVVVENERNGEKVGEITGTAVLGPEKTGSDGTLTYDWSFDITEGTGYAQCAAKEGDNYKYVIRVVAENALSLEGQAETTLAVDAKDPEFSPITVTPIINGDGTESNPSTVNGVITVRASVEETYLSNTKLELIQDGTVLPKSYTKTSTLIEQKINTTDESLKIKDEKPLTFKFTATDRAGNNKNAEYTCYVSQKTDKPSVAIAGAEDSTVVKSADGIKEGVNLFSQGGNVSISSTDDDGKPKVKLTVYKGEKASAEKVVKELEGESSISYNLPNEQSVYTLVVESTDTNKSDPIPPQVTKKTYYVAVDAGAPQFKEVTPAANQYVNLQDGMAVKGTIEDGSGIKSISVEIGKEQDGTVVYDNKGGESALVSASENHTFVLSDKPKTYSLEDKITIDSDASGTYVVRYTATDIYERSQEYTIRYNIDSGAPTFKITRIGNDTLGTALEGGNATPPAEKYLSKSSGFLDVSGTVQDDVAFDGSVYYALAVSEPDYEKLTDTNVWNRGGITSNNNQTGSWSVSIPVSGLDSGKTYALYVTFKDNAGNISKPTDNPSGIVTVIPDGDKPTIGDFTSSTQSISSSNQDKPVTFTVTGVSDGDKGSGIQKVCLYENGKEISTLTESGDTWECSLTNATYPTLYASGVHTISVKATDNVGNESDAKTVTISVDSTPPTARINSITPTVTKDGTSYLNGVVEASITLTDESALSKTGCYWYVTKKGEADRIAGVEADSVTDNVISVDENDIRYKTVSLSVNTTKITGENATDTTGKGEYTLHVYALDDGGNSVEATADLNIDQSTDYPTISMTGLDASVTADDINTIHDKGKNHLFGTSATLNGSASDDDGSAQVTVSVHKGKTAEGVLVDSQTYTNTISHPLPKDEGYYTIVVTASDTNSGSPIPQRTTTQKYCIAVDAGVPEFVDVTPVNGNYYSSEITVSFTITDGNGISSLKRRIQKGESGGFVDAPGDFGKDSDVTTKIGKEGAFSETISIPTDDGDYRVLYTATDVFGCKLEKTINYKVDSAAPMFTITSIDGKAVSLSGGDVEVQSPVYLSKSTGVLEVEGTVNDSVSGFDGFAYYALTNTVPDYTDLSSTDKWTRSAITTADNKFGTWKLSIPVTAEKYTHGTPYTLYMTFKDGADNISLPKDNPSGKVTAVPDGKPPVIETLEASPRGLTSANKGADVVITATIKDDLSGVASVALYENTKLGIEAVKNGDEYTFNITKDTYPELYESGSHKLEVRATDNANNTKTGDVVTISVDTQEPKVSINSVAPRVSKDGDEFLNGTVRVTANLTDDTSLADGTAGTSNCYWYVTGPDEAATKVIEDTTIPISSTEKQFKNLTIDLDTTTISGDYAADGSSGKGKYTLHIYAVDEAGNHVEKTEILNIDQSTDIPEITFNKADGEKLGIEGNTIQISAKDDDELGVVKYSLDGGDEVTPFDRTTASAKRTEFSQSITLPDDISTDTHTLTVVVEDYVEGRAEDKKRTKTQTLTFIYDNANPTVSINALEEFQSESVTITGTAEDEAGIDKVVGVLSKNGTVVQGSEVEATLIAKERSANPTSYNWTANVSIADPDEAAQYKWTFTATDKNDRKGSSFVEYKVDTTKPVLVDDPNVDADKITFKAGRSIYYTDKITADNSTVWFKEGEGSITISGKLEEANRDYVTMTIVGKNSDGTNRDESVNYATATERYSINNTYYDGTNTVTLTAHDKAKNASDTRTFSLKVDTNAPRLESSKVTDANGQTVTGMVNTRTLKISYSATDLVLNSTSNDVSGLEKILIGVKYGFDESKALWNSHKEGETAAFTAGNPTYTVADDAPIEVSLDNPEISDGSNTLYIRLFDVAGNKYEEELVTFTYDASPATVSIVSPIAGATVNKTITITGSVSDNQALPDTLNGRLQIKLDGANWTDVGEQKSTFSKTGSSSWECTLDTTAYNATGDDKEVAIRVIIPDAAGNENTADEGREIIINQDSDRPKIVLTNIDITDSAIKQSRTVYGSLTDDDSDSEGVVKGLYIIDKDSFAEGQYPIDDGDDKGENGVTTNNGWTKLDVQLGSGSFSHEGSKDGLLAFYFYCIDNGGEKFYGASGDDLKRIKIAGMSNKSDFKADKTGISYTADMDSPEVKMSVARGDARDVFSDGIMVFSKTGDYRKLYIKLAVTEAVGMKKDTETASGYALPTIRLNDNPLDISAYMHNEVRDGETSSYTYTVGPIDLASADSSNTSDGAWSLKAEVRDAADQVGATNMNITMDSSAPEILITSPSASISDAVLSAITVKGLAQDASSQIKDLRWAIPLKSKLDDYNTKEDNIGLFTPIGNSTAWEIQFTSGSEDSPDSLLYFANAKDGADFAYNIKPVQGVQGVFEVPIYFYVEDTVGNKAVQTTYWEVSKTDETVKVKKPLMVYVDADGGKPKAWINSPENESKTSGVLTIYGGASDNISVAQVQIQVDVNANGIYDKSDYDLIKGGALGSAVVDLLYGTSSDWWISATGTNSWKVTIDTTGIATNTMIGIHCRAYDNESTPLTRDWGGEIKVKIDSSAPTIRDVKLVQFGKGVDSKAKAADLVNKTPVSELEYTSGIYISNVSVENSGDWFLCATISDNDGIGSITAEKINISTSTNIIVLEKDLLANCAVDCTDPAYTYKTKKIFVPINTEKSGMVYSTITVADTAEKANFATKEIRVNIDSTAPSLFNTDNLVKSDVGDELRLKPSNSQNPLGENVQVVNSNGLFTFGDYIQEAESGLAYLAFYFERESTMKIFDPMQKDVSAAYSNTKTNGAVYKNTPAADKAGYGLPVLYLSSAGREDENSLTSPSIGAYTSNSDVKKNGFIRKGGIVKIGGSYRLITAVSGNTVTFNPPCSTTFKEAEIVFAQIVDHQITESVDGGKVTPETDDGDGMIESVNHIGSSYIWSASIDSANVTDGPIYIGVAAIDNAGNIAMGRIKTVVSNNRPRIAKVMLGTDLNGDGKFTYAATKTDYVPSHDISEITAEEDKNDLLSYIKNKMVQGASYGEFNYYGTMTLTGIASYEAELPSGNFKVVEGFCLLPEFVGGNGKIQYIMKQASTEQSPDYLQKATGSSLVAMHSKDALTSTGVAMGSHTFKVAEHKDNPESTQYESVLISEKGGIVIESLSQSLVGADDKTYLSFTFWDETEDTNPGTTSQWAHLQVPITYLTNEGNVPTPTITPFHWKSKTENSVYKDADGNLQGHIEFIETPPNVSGKIEIEGIVTDDVRLKSVVVNVKDIVTNATLNYTNGEWKYTGSLASVISFTGEDEEISQKGHTMKWKLVCDTETLSTKAGTNKYVNVSATDWKNNTLKAEGAKMTPIPHGVEGSSQYTGDSRDDYRTAYYSMNVVPYITGVWTSLSEFYRSAPSVYARTAQGRYPVYEGEKITIYGYNLSSTMTAKIGTVPLTIGAKATEVRPAMTGTGYNVTIPSSAESGSLALSVNGVAARNNANNDDAKDKYEGEDVSHWYNRQPNGVNNNTLNDDVKFDVWEFKTAATPMNGQAEYVTMKINPKTGMPGFSYANSILYFNMPGYISNQDLSAWNAKDGVGEGPYSQLPMGMNYGGFTHNTFTFDSNGYAYGAAISTDTQTATASAYFQFFSREQGQDANNNDQWGKYGMNQNMNYHNQANASRLDSTSVQIKNGSAGWITNINRIQSPSMDTRVVGDVTYVYMAYYDDATKQVRFRWGTVGDQPHKIDGRQDAKAYNAGPSFNHNLLNNYGLSDVVKEEVTGVPMFDSNDGNNRQSNVEDSYVKYSKDKGGIPIQIIASTGIANAISYYATPTTYKAGKYVSLSMYGEIAIVSWYDEVSRKLIMAYNTSPTTSKMWNYRVIDSDAGLNVKTAVDGKGGIHFAYYKSTGSDLKYAYLSSTTATPEIVTVDSFGAVGAKCTIDVAKVGDNCVPYIGYQNNGYLGTQAAAKIAYRTDFKSAPYDGSDTSDYLTGKWEVSVVPTKNIPKDDLINLGVYKDSSGNLQSFPSKNASDYKTKSFTNKASAVGDATIVWANGTSNPLLGYGIDDGTIEMAQKK